MNQDMHGSRTAASTTTNAAPAVATDATTAAATNATTNATTAAATDGVASPVTLSETAATKLRKVMDEKGITNGLLRLFVTGGGCSGMQYGMGFDTNVEDGDQVFEATGMRLVVDHVSMSYMHGAHVDYVDELMGGGFKIDNPNAAKSCGCGSSFKPANGSARDAPEAPPGMSCGGCG